MHRTILIALFLSYVSSIQTARILSIFQFPANSHFTCNNAILKSLANAGHEITVVTVFPGKVAKENYTSVIDVSQGQLKFVGINAVEDFSTMTFRDWIKFFRITNTAYGEKVFNLKEIKDILNSKEKLLFDVIIVEILMYERYFHWIATKLKIPVIGVITTRSWFPGDLEVSNPRHPFLPNELSKNTFHGNFCDRLQRAFDYFEALCLYYWFYYMKNDLNQFFEKYVTGHISFGEFMEGKPSLVFINSHFSYFPRPLNPNVIEIGGITLSTNQQLPKNIEIFLDEAKQGAILFTFGSVVKATKLPKHKVRAFVEAFAEIPQRVIWKYEEQIEGLSKNVMIMDWVPQPDILAHKNVKAFISHCGQGAIHESLHHGVPLISCPLFFDQHANANIFENLQIAIRLDYETISKDSVLEVLNEIINNTKYYENMQKLSNSFKDRPMTPQQSVVYWTEYVIRHNGAPQSPIAKLNWVQYLLLDVICFISLLLFTISYSLYFICKKICFHIAFRNKTKS